MASQKITVIKNDHTGKEVWRYEGRVLQQTDTCVQLEALFDRDDMDLGYARFRRGDRFVEWFYTDRWYSIFQIHDAEDDAIKGWYCNFSRPASIANGCVAADDLALDMFVYPDGRTLLLDQDEFDALPITDPVRDAVLAALEELQARVAAQAPPFDRIAP